MTDIDGLKSIRVYLLRADFRQRRSGDYPRVQVFEKESCEKGLAYGVWLHKGKSMGGLTSYMMEMGVRVVEVEALIENYSSHRAAQAGEKSEYYRPTFFKYVFTGCFKDLQLDSVLSELKLFEVLEEKASENFEKLLLNIRKLQTPDILPNGEEPHYTFRELALAYLEGRLNDDYATSLIANAKHKTAYIQELADFLDWLKHKSK